MRITGKAEGPRPRPRARPRAVLWDLDGTLIDSTEYHFRSWLEPLRREGVHISKADFLATFGQRNDTILKGYFGSDADPARIRRVADEKEAGYRAIIRAEGLEPLPGAAGWVRRLHEAAWRQAIASSAPRENVDVVLQMLGFGDLIEVTVSADDVRVGKPDPEVFLTAAAKLGVQPDRSIVVEDAPAGVEAARRGGMRCIGVGGGQVAGADVVVPSLVDLPPDAFDRLVPP